MRLTNYMQLDLFFSDYKPQNIHAQVATKKAGNDSSCSTSDDSNEKQSPRQGGASLGAAKQDSEEERILHELQK